MPRLLWSVASSCISRLFLSPQLIACMALPRYGWFLSFGPSAKSQFKITGGWLTVTHDFSSLTHFSPGQPRLATGSQCECCAPMRPSGNFVLGLDSSLYLLYDLYSARPCSHHYPNNSQLYIDRCGLHLLNLSAA